jgi:hypothetical protein
VAGAGVATGAAVGADGTATDEDGGRAGCCWAPGELVTGWTGAACATVWPGTNAAGAAGCDVGAVTGVGAGVGAAADGAATGNWAAGAAVGTGATAAGTGAGGTAAGACAICGDTVPLSCAKAAAVAATDAVT